MVGLTDPNLCKTKSNHDSLLQIPGINHFVWSPLPVVAGFTLCMPCTSTISMMTQGRITTLSWTERNNDILSLFHVCIIAIMGLMRHFGASLDCNTHTQCPSIHEYTWTGMWHSMIGIGITALNLTAFHKMGNCSH